MKESVRKIEEKNAARAAQVAEAEADANGEGETTEEAPAQDA
jgi:hypothetical protein